jgi:putative thiamine transport system ATP-binding protein
MPGVLLKLDHLSIRLGSRELISITANIEPGEILTVMGESGSGKSTLLACIAGFLDPAFSADGRIWLGEKDITGIPPQERQVGLMFQDPLLFPHMSVGENLMFALRPGASRQVRRAMVQAALEEAGMPDFFHRDPATLSGGQKARAALMRVLLAQPQALLLDEPFSRLDAGRRNRIRDFVFTEIRQRQLPALLVTHDPEDARHAGGAVFELNCAG